MFLCMYICVRVYVCVCDVNAAQCWPWCEQEQKTLRCKSNVNWKKWWHSCSLSRVLYYSSSAATTTFHSRMRSQRMSKESKDEYNDLKIIESPPKHILTDEYKITFGCHGCTKSFFLQLMTRGRGVWIIMVCVVVFAMSFCQLVYPVLQVSIILQIHSGRRTHFYALLPMQYSFGKDYALCIMQWSICNLVFCRWGRSISICTFSMHFCQCNILRVSIMHYAMKYLQFSIL